MIQFYITESGVYNPAQITDPTQAFVIDIQNKRLKLMETYTLEFQRLTEEYATSVDSSNVTGVSQKGVNAMYKDLQAQIEASAGVTSSEVSEQINSSLIPVNTSITTINGSIGTINSSVSTIETKLGTIAEGAEVNVNPDWNAISGDASILNRPVLGSLAYKDSLDASEVGAVPTASVGVANGIAQLDGNGKVPESQLPSYVDDVQEYDSSTLFPATGESGIIYVSVDDNLTYRWGGSTYIEISKSLALGETASTAYAGDKGKALKDAFDASAVDWNDAASKKHEHSNKGVLDGITDSSFHTHSNKSVLDNITSEDVTGWDTAATDAHTHSNSDVLNGITDSSFHSHINKTALDTISATDITNWIDASNAKHSHDNKAILDGIADSSFHTHTNKEQLDAISSTDITNWNDASNAKHSHDNKAVLDGVTDSSFHTHSNKEQIDTITTEALQSWNSAANNSHTHTNKEALDTISATDIANFIDASNAKHSHDNKTILDSIIDSSFHTHTNKSILDGLTDASISNWDDAKTKAHEHTNKNILDGIKSKIGRASCRERV